MKASELLDIALTRRKDNDIPMAGIPVHAIDNYLERLIRKGVMVAVCDQVESIKDRKGTALLKREVTRLYALASLIVLIVLYGYIILRITPGTLTEDKFLNARQSNFLAAVAVDMACSKA